jgi:hypothetical protein
MAPPPPDCYAATVTRVGKTARAAKDAIDAAVQQLEQSRDERSAGTALADVIDKLLAAGGRELRLGATEAFHEYERATAAVRGCVVRTLVDEQGFSFTQVGEKLRISRQAVVRLYREHPAHTDQE